MVRPYLGTAGLSGAAAGGDGYPRDPREGPGQQPDPQAFIGQWLSHMPFYSFFTKE